MKQILKRLIGQTFPRLKAYSRIRHGFTDRHGRQPNLLFPTTFSEKVQRRKLLDRDPRLPRLADKIAAKDYVADKLGKDWIIPTLWSGTQLPEQPAWPIPFVVKASHGSGMNAFVRRPDELDWPKIRALSAQWLANRTYGSWGGEWLYSQIPPRLLVEPFMGDLSTLPLDYKLWVFAGRLAFIQVDVDRETGHKRTMFDADWNEMPFTTGWPKADRPLARPASLPTMIAAAETLGADFPFVRVDLYEIEGSPKFGELTFYPDSGWARFDPPHWDTEIGKLWR
ncbi:MULTISPECIES: ATP-grasp fold amidoligase family protein [unclassified Bradyrhizobium]|uniref:ATP-grasp fold amidoligase family protein n=1 Tax=unclassified Bradyrhizobium TaxID=2631580 RepID=UPI002916D426|nr:MULTISPECIES: ATP-grasp fold amidoligase family protein [unclassified Bradyrhizobium]